MPGFHLAPAAGAGEVPPGLGARVPRGVAGPVAAAGPRIAEGVFASRYAGAMLLHAFASQADAAAVLRLLAHNAEHWLSRHLNAYLCDDDKYRAITRETIIRGLAGVISYTPDAITVQLEEPGAPRVTRALRLLLEEINQAPPSLPGDPRPIIYQLAARHHG